MAIYGLSVFLETPKHLRKGRFPFIVLSFVITIFTALSGSLDAVWIFQHLFRASSGESFYDALLEDVDSSWGRILSLAAFTVVIIIGDALLVRAFHPSLRFFPQFGKFLGLSLLCDVVASLVGHSATCSKLRCLRW